MNNIFLWQESKWQYLIDRKQNGTFPHALLLTGSSGIGKQQFVTTLAQYLLCKHTEDNMACGKCSSCKLFKAGNHPDYLQIAPEEDSNAIKIEQIRALINVISKKAHQQNGQVVFVNPAHALNIAASNALLKTLEEPQGEVYFLLVTEYYSMLAATIRSRCQKLVFSSPSKELAAKWLAQNTTSDNLDALLRLSNYAPLQAKQIHDEQQLLIRNMLLQDFTKLLEKQITVVDFASHYTDASQKIIIFYLQAIIFDLLCLKLEADTKLLKNCDQLSLLQSIAPNLSRGQLFTIYDDINRAVKNSANNLNMPLWLEELGLLILDGGSAYAG